MFVKLHNKSCVEILLYKSATPPKLINALSPGSKKILLAGLLLLFIATVSSQTLDTVFVKDTKAANRDRLYKNMLRNGITKNLSYPLTDSTEENWMDAFYNLEFIRYKAPWIENQVAVAFAGIDKRSVAFQRSLLALLYTNYPLGFDKPVFTLLNHTANDKIFAMCAEYLLEAKPALQKELWNKTLQMLQADTGSAILRQLIFRLGSDTRKIKLPLLSDLLRQPFFKNAVVLFSFQRKNRDYPGMVVVRDSAGNFVKNELGNLFAVPQLARSITNLPGYLSFGNTPQGIFRMFGMAVSESIFIGPTPNLQMTMPFETSLQHFMNDSSITDTVWTTDWYKKLLPKTWQQYFPIMETYYAGKAGRTEIIAHGTTIDPAYYTGQPYYPHTPSLGCLSTKELWDEADGRRLVSNQQQLVAAIHKAGGANGYCIVLELDDEQRPVTIADILPLLK
jgi:hypothetical protein